MKFCYVLTFLGAVVGFVVLVVTVLFADSAPKEAAGAATAVGWAVVPYVLARAVEKIGGPREVRIADLPLTLVERAKEEDEAVGRREPRLG